MIFKSQILTQASGSIGGITYSHNKGGMYTRARATPTNPGTEQQSQVRQIMGDLAKRWTNTLTGTQRTAWSLYATNVPLINRLGESKSIPGLAMFVRCMTPRVQAGLTIIDDGPTTYSLPNFTAPANVINESDQKANLAYANADLWATEVGGAMLLSMSKPQNAAVIYFKGPYRYKNKVAGAIIPPTSPLETTLPYPVVEGQKVFSFVRVTRADGRLSEPFRLESLVAA